MLSAVYYPHTAIRDEDFLKHALLYWDEIEYISPWEDFNALPRYSENTTQVLSKFLTPRVPTQDEKLQAHEEVMKLLDGDLPAWLQVDRTSSEAEKHMYSMFKDKLMPDTWEELSKRQVVFQKHGDVEDYSSHTYLGLTLMAILARCCAGSLKHTITDQTDSYETFIKHIEFLSGTSTPDGGPLDSASRSIFQRWLNVLGTKRAQTEDAKREQLVSITLEIIDSKTLSVDSLVKLRTDKSAFGTELRNNYSQAVETYVDKLSEPDIKISEAVALKAEFRKVMSRDLTRLHEELAPAALKAVLSKELAVAVAAPLVGSAILASSGIGAPLGGAIAIGALGKLQLEYRSSRNTVFAKHPMAFLYKGKRFRLY